MAVTGKRGVGIPTILLHDGEGTIVTVELKNGDLYRGFLDETEDNMNCVLKDAYRTDLRGMQSHCDQVYLRGSQILFIIFPDMLKHAPFFKRVKLWKKHKGSIPALGLGGGAHIGLGNSQRGPTGAMVRKGPVRR
ncbi:small nuclear ribonucleoprotein D3 [Saprolegnia diclina VS20]|uniref:Small nuclear ribonucleoprotein Sm D3 n=1 Tax=Saprolegnia diclina (strain VS20) TaxID=1156394 RepID=T0RD94_SAPDV|nr:small nuclear ribonucleoprotein D3 [Saprolegnia diclina VS20]EQC27542.1 small nuclear ribonucleoprotein D3 [Saprolegnia diclina VS20]|eukprot:XP_008618962.1 small nuclear ribonucleoprotein D3 [Saprolegnia diclina VS20]